jgi:Immunity protein Imm1
LVSSDDVDRLIDSLLAGEEFHNLAELHSLDRELLPSGFPDHELLVGVSRTCPVGVLEFMDASGNFVTLGQETGRGVVNYHIAGNPTEFPDRAEVPVELIRQAVKEFVTSGGQRPACVEWQVPEIW